MPQGITLTNQERFAIPLRASFNNVALGTTTGKFELPAGVGLMWVFMVDNNNPGTATLQKITSGTTTTEATVTTGSGDMPDHFGFARFQTTGGTFQVACTIAKIDRVAIYFQE